MFVPENPIAKIEEDILGRKNFATHLSNALARWTEKESLVIAVYGKWGSGKTSLVNMATDLISRDPETNSKLSTVRFNPWVFSESGDLLTHFVEELIKSIKKDRRPNVKLIRNLEYYLGLISLVPNRNQTISGLRSVVTVLAVSGISVGQIFSSNLPIVGAILTWTGIAVVAYQSLRGMLSRLLSYLHLKQARDARSVSDLKEEICSELTRHGKRLVVVIDDIDRLTKKEMRAMFRIIRTNADFPNTIYLLSFDREIVEANLSVQAGVSGRDYLEKIIQVSFNIPKVSDDSIVDFLIKELNRVLATLPHSANQYFEKSDTHWVNVFNSGFRYYFQNLRDVKRYISTVEFNISQMFLGDEMEVNPIDFMAIELVRLFEPDFYSFVMRNRELFTNTGESSGDREGKKKMILDALQLASDVHRDHLRELIFVLFPQVKGFASGYGNTHYPSDWQKTWTKDLKICSTRMFDAYFSYLPGGNEKELSRYELGSVKTASSDYNALSSKFAEFKEIGKLEKFLDVVQSYTDDPTFFEKENYPVVIRAFFELFQDLPKVERGFFGLGLDMQIIRIVYQLLKRNPDLEENFQILSGAAQEANYFYGGLYFLSIEIHKSEKTEESTPELIPASRVEDAKKLGLGLIEANRDQVLASPDMLSILYRWVEWSDIDVVKKFLSEELVDDEAYLDFVSKFAYEQKSQSVEDYGFRRVDRFNYKSLKDFFDLENAKARLEACLLNPNLSERFRQMIDIFMKGFKNRDKEGPFWND